MYSLKQEINKDIFLCLDKSTDELVVFQQSASNPNNRTILWRSSSYKSTSNFATPEYSKAIILQQEPEPINDGYEQKNYTTKQDRTEDDVKGDDDELKKAQPRKNKRKRSGQLPAFSIRKSPRLGATPKKKVKTTQKYHNHNRHMVLICDLVDQNQLKIGDYVYYKNFNAIVNSDKRLEWEIHGKKMYSESPTAFSNSCGDKSRKGWHKVMYKGQPLMKLREELDMSLVEKRLNGERNKRIKEAKEDTE